MPSVEIPISASLDDQYVFQDSASYPPSSGVTRNTTANVAICGRSFSTTYRVICGLLVFQTASYLPDNCTITEAKLRCVPTLVQNANSKSVSADYYLLNSTNADYTSTPGTNAHAGTALASLTLNVDNDLVLLNPDTNISKTANTGLRLHLADDTQPTGANQLNIASWDHTTLQEPRLIVDYTLSTTRLAPDAIAQQSGFSPAVTLSTVQTDPDV